MYQSRCFASHIARNAMCDLSSSCFCFVDKSPLVALVALVALVSLVALVALVALMSRMLRSIPTRSTAHTNKKLKSKWIHKVERLLKDLTYSPKLAPIRQINSKAQFTRK